MGAAMNVKKLSFSLSPETAERLERVSGYLQVSKSALVDQLLSGATADMCSALDLLPNNPENVTEGDMVRLRGGSVAIVQSRIDDLKEQLK